MSIRPDKFHDIICAATPSIKCLKTEDKIDCYLHYIYSYLMDMKPGDQIPVTWCDYLYNYVIYKNNISDFNEMFASNGLYLYDSELKRVLPYDCSGTKKADITMQEYILRWEK